MRDGASREISLRTKASVARFKNDRDRVAPSIDGDEVGLAIRVEVADRDGNGKRTSGERGHGQEGGRRLSQRWQRRTEEDR